MASKNIDSNNRMQNGQRGKLNNKHSASTTVLDQKDKGFIRRKLAQFRALLKSRNTEKTKTTFVRNNNQQPNNDIIRPDFKPTPVKSLSLTDLRQANLPVRPKPLFPEKITSVSNGTIRVCYGDITTQRVDVVVITSTSDTLREYVLQKAGNSIRTLYDNEKARKPDKAICTNGGNLSCKRVYFIPCPKLSHNPDAWAFRNFVSEAFQLAKNDSTSRVQSIAFPAIGCGLHSCDVNFVAKTLIQAVAYQLEHQPSLRFDVYFFIQQNQKTIFDTFKNQVIALNNDRSSDKNSPSSNIVAHLPPRPPKTPQKIHKQSSPDKRLLDKSSNEYTQVLKQFTDAMTSGLHTEIIRIELVWNTRWYGQYRIHKKDFYRRLQSDTEKHLFHGCHEDAANKIIKECFNRSYAGQHGVVYGHGAYFSSKASYSHKYATPNSKGERCMFLADVLIGKTTVGNSSMKVCPAGYDSTTDGSHIYVVYHDAQSFGHYLITYR